MTGSDGFVGPWVVEALAARGARVHALVKDGTPSGHPCLHRISACGACPSEGDVTDLDRVTRLLGDRGIDTVIHLAAINVNVGTSVSPFEIFETNTRGTVTVLEACRLMGGARIVLASSREAEDCFSKALIRKIHPYMASKAAAELAARAYADSYGLPAVAMRSDNLYGGGDLNWNRLVPATIRAVLSGQPPVIRGNGASIRDYVYVEDAVEAYIAAAERAHQPSVRGQLFRIATGLPVTTLELVRKVLKAARSPNLEPVVMNEPVDERVDSIYDPVRERSVLGWSPRTPLDEGLTRTFAAYSNGPLGSR